MKMRDYDLMLFVLHGIRRVAGSGGIGPWGPVREHALVETVGTLGLHSKYCD